MPLLPFTLFQKYRERLREGVRPRSSQKREMGEIWMEGKEQASGEELKELRLSAQKAMGVRGSVPVSLGILFFLLRGPDRKHRFAGEGTMDGLLTITHPADSCQCGQLRTQGKACSPKDKATQSWP